MARRSQRIISLVVLGFMPIVVAALWLSDDPRNAAPVPGTIIAVIVESMAVLNYRRYRER